MPTMGNVTRKHARYTLMRDVNSIKGICEVLRLIYDEIYSLENNEKITELLVDAMMMAKKMHNRLTYYKTTYNDTTGHNLKNLERLRGCRDRERMRKTR